MPRAGSLRGTRRPEPSRDRRAARRPAGRSVQELADALPISRPAVSRHLRLLKEAGLVREEPVGTRRIYRLHDAGIEAVRAYLERVWGEAAARFALVASNTTPGASGDRADPPQLRRRLPGRSRVRGLDRADRDVVAGRPHGVGRGRHPRRPGGPARRPDLRADARPASSTTGARSRSGSRRRGSATCGTCAATAPTRPRSRSGSSPATPARPASRSSIAAGSGSAPAARSGGTGTTAAGRRCCRTTWPRRTRDECAPGTGVGRPPVGVACRLRQPVAAWLPTRDRLQPERPHARAGRCRPR